MPINARLSRRSVLRGAGALLALPWLEAMLPRAARAAEATGGPPRRMVICTVTGGTVLESWKPAAEGSLADMKLPSILRPLEFAKQDMLLLTGLAQSGKSEGLNGHEHCAFLHLTGADIVKKVDGKAHAAISVDQAAAQVVGEQTFLPSLEIGLSNHETRYSFRAPEAPVPYESDPRLVFERMFRGRKPAIPDWTKRSKTDASAVTKSARANSLEQSVVDLVLEDAKGLAPKLGKPDQRKLDEYLHAVRAVEKRIAFVEARQQQDVLDDAAAAKRLKIPGGFAKEGTPIWQITNPVMRDTEKHADYLRVMVDLLVLALQTDTTRVATLAMGSDEASFPGVVTVGYERHAHTLQHQGNSHRVEDADPIAREACRQIHAWYTTMFAELIARMKTLDEGGSSMLDNSMVLYTSYMADGGHGRHDYPVLLCGKAGGALKPGRVIRYKDKTPVSNLYAEMLNRMGVPTEKFGDNQTSEHRQYDGRLPDLS